MIPSFVTNGTGPATVADDTLAALFALLDERGLGACVSRRRGLWGVSLFDMVTDERRAFARAFGIADAFRNAIEQDARP